MILSKATLALPPGIVFATIRLLCNALNTSRRYRHAGVGHLIRDCPWCGNFGMDDVWHVTRCPKVCLALRDKWDRIALPEHSESAIRFFCMLDMPEVPEALERIVIADLVVKFYQSIPTNAPNIVVRQMIQIQ